MLTYVLALAVGLGSFALYMAAFFFPEVHRKNDLIWSGVGLFYALILWVCAARITGAVLLGQTASVALLSWLGWQTIVLRRQVAPMNQQTAVPTAAELKASLTNLSSSDNVAKVSGQIGRQVSQLGDRIQTAIKTATQPKPTVPTNEPYVPLTPADFGGARSPESTIDPDPASPTASGVSPEAVTVPVTQPNPLREILAMVQSVLKGLTQKRESKPVYVRKQYRDSTIEVGTPEVQMVDVTSPSAADVAATEATLLENELNLTHPVAVDTRSDSTMPSDEILQEEIAYEAARQANAETTPPKVE
jgi:hypothetical protein